LKFTKPMISWTWLLKLLAHPKRHICGILWKLPHFEQLPRFKTFFKYRFTWFIIFSRFSFFPSFCNVTFRNFRSFLFLKNAHSLATFPSSSYFSIFKITCESKIFHVFLNFATFQMFLPSQIFDFSNTERSLIFSKRFRIFETSYIYKFVKNSQFLLN
jgi:hypothetical protein